MFLLGPTGLSNAEVAREVARGRPKIATKSNVLATAAGANALAPAVHGGRKENRTGLGRVLQHNRSVFASTHLAPFRMRLFWGKRFPVVSVAGATSTTG